MRRLLAPVAIGFALRSAFLTFVVLVRLTPIEPTHRVVITFLLIDAGIILLLVGIAVQIHLWKVYPIWFHLIFWALLIPMTILGGRMKQTA